MCVCVCGVGGGGGSGVRACVSMWGGDSLKGKKMFLSEALIG